MSGGCTGEERNFSTTLQERIYVAHASAVARGDELGLPLAFVDVEVMLDGTAILHALPWDACDATPALNELAISTGLTVRLLDLSRTPTAKEPATSGCGKPGCGSEAGGCSTCGTSTGACLRGSEGGRTERPSRAAARDRGRARPRRGRCAWR